MRVVFSDPPPAAIGPAVKYAEIFDACKARPLEWAEYPGSPSTSRYRYGYRFTKRNIDGRRKVWVRYDPALDRTLVDERRSTELSTSHPQKLRQSSSGDSQATNGLVKT